MSMILLNHAGQEFAHHQEMRHCVDLEGLSNLGLWLIEDGSVVSDARIIDQDGGITVRCTDLLRYIANVL